MTQCPNCPHPIPDGKKQCIYCGAVLTGSGGNVVPPLTRGEALQPRALVDLEPILLFGGSLSSKTSARGGRRIRPMRPAMGLLAFLTAFAFGTFVVLLLR